MSDTPFWKQNVTEGDTVPQAPADAIPTVPGGTSAIDPKTGEWRPIKRGDPFTMAGHEFRWSEGPIATATLHDSDGNELGTVHIPFDPETQQPGDDDMLAEATRFYDDMEYMRSIVKDDAVEQLVKSIHDSGTAKEMVGIVAEVAAGSLSLNVSDEDGSDGLTSEQLEALATEGERLFNQHLPDVIGSIAENPGFRSDGSNFWQVFAREIIATATLNARNDTTETLGGPEAVEAMGGGAFEAEVLEAYRTGPFITGAMLSLTRIWTQTLAEVVGTTMTTLSESEGKAIAETLLKAARKSLDMGETPALQKPPTATPAFKTDGYGRAKNDIVSIGARRALAAAASRSRWPLDVDGFPAFTHENGSGKALYSPSRLHFPTASDAMRAVEGYGPSHVAMLKFIKTKYMANSEAGTAGPYGGFYLSIEEFLDTVGRAKHAKGGYRPEDRREVVELIEALAHIDVTGSIEGYEKQPGKRGRKSTLTIRSPLIVVSQTVTQPGIMPESEERPIAWYLRPGDWAAELDRFGPQFAVATRALLQLNPQNEMHAFKLGCMLEEEYRIRANQRSWKQPYRVCKLLEGAEIEVDRKHAGRFRERIEAAFDVLSNPVTMNGTPLIESWEYTSVVEAKGRGWFDRWLVAGIVITPPAGLITPYQAIGRNRRKPQKLAG